MEHPTRYRSHRSRSRLVAFAVAVALAWVGTVARAPARAETPQEEIARQVPAALKILDAWHADQPVPADRRLHVVYWTPADREPAPQYSERLSRVLFDIRGFYLGEMRRLGFGDRTIRLDTEPDELLKIHLVQGSKPYASYNVDSGGAIRTECLPTLKAAGLDADHETIVIFCNMSNWDPVAGTMTQNSPYYAGGGLRGGTAWQVDSPLLDPDLIAKKEPIIRDGQYGRISVGKYNSIFVGGVCHELGHALGLPHNSERPAQREAFGTALMGGGNRTYGDDRRDEGRGSFLTLAEGLRLAGQPIFSGSAKGIDLPAGAKLDDVKVETTEDGKAFTFAARVTADPPAFAVVGYMDPAGGSDYDAPTCTAIPDSAGRFTLNCDALRRGKPATLRVVVCQANGGRIGDRTFSLPYYIGADGTVDLSAFQATTRLAGVVSAVNAKDAAAASAAVRALEDSNADARTLDVAETLAGTLDFKPGPTPAEAAGDVCNLSEATWQSARIGWGKPAVNRLPGDTALLRAGGQLFARGLYAHAPSGYRYDLGGKWSRLTAKAGIAAGFDGSVVFVVRGDEKELWRSKKVKSDEPVVDVALDVKGVKTLELRIENAGDGNSGDWGLWLEPVLGR